MGTFEIVLGIIKAVPAVRAAIADWVGHPAETADETLARLAASKLESGRQEAEWAKDMPPTTQKGQ